MPRNFFNVVVVLFSISKIHLKSLLNHDRNETKTHIERRNETNEFERRAPVEKNASAKEISIRKKGKNAQSGKWETDQSSFDCGPALWRAMTILVRAWQCSVARITIKSNNFLWFDFFSLRCSFVCLLRLRFQIDRSIDAIPDAFKRLCFGSISMRSEEKQEEWKKQYCVVTFIRLTTPHHPIERRHTFRPSHNRRPVLWLFRYAHSTCNYNQSSIIMCRQFD